MLKIVKLGISAIAFAAASGCATPQSPTQLTPTALAQNPITAVVVPFFDAVAREDLTAAKAFFAPEAKVRAMFNPNGENGAAAVRTFPADAYFTLVTRNYDNLVFSDRSYSVADGGAVVWMEAQGDLVVTATQKPYRNGYVFKLTLKDGKIETLQEWVNTVTVSQQGVVARVQGQ